ncbi:MAG: hypothetical protein HZA23_04965 [Nitrospirae bacterium]|nr:hypothetical protein [Nitrospirota bacterium]
MKQGFISEQTVIEVVKRCVAETLRIEEQTMTPSSSLIKELGAESLDFLDMNYRLEQAFGIKMARHFLLEHVEEAFGEGSAVDANNQLTEPAVRLLKIRLGDHLSELKAGMEMDEVPALITVQSLANNVLDLLDTLPECCPSCGQAAWKTEDGARIRCGSCGSTAAFTNGDELIRQWLKRVQEEQRIFAS